VKIPISFKASAFLKELERLQPMMLEACRRAYSNARQDLDFLRLDPDAFAASPSDSIDYVNLATSTNRDSGTRNCGTIAIKA